MQTSSLNRAGWRSTIRSTVTGSAFVLIVAACEAGAASDRGTSGTGLEITAGPSLAASPSQVASLGASWERITIQPALDAPLTSVVWTGTQFLAVGGVFGTVVASTDGRTWQPQQRIEDGLLGQVVAGPQGVLGIGSRNAEGVVAIWRSADGITWTSAPDDASLRGGGFLTMATIVDTDGGWLAVGGETLSCIPRACRLVRAVTWTSPDGLAWTRGVDSAAMLHAEMWGVVHTPSDYLAVGDAAADPTQTDSAIRPAVWTSSDGRSWARSAELPRFAAAEDADVILDSVTTVGDRVVAVGHVSTQTSAAARAFAWWRDGDTWSVTEIGQFIPSQGVRLVAVPGGLLALFGPGTGTSCSSSIWSSDDGSSWSCIGNDPVFADSTVSDAAVSPDAEVLVGSGPDGAAVWTSARH